MKGMCECADVFCPEMQCKGLCIIKDMPVCSGNYGWVDDPGEKEKVASYGCRCCFRF